MADGHDNTNTGCLWPNNYKREAKHPDYRGTFTDAYNKVWDAAIWARVSKAGRQYLSLSITEPRNKDGQPREQTTYTPIGAQPLSTEATPYSEPDPASQPKTAADSLAEYEAAQQAPAPAAESAAVKESDIPF